MDRNDINKKIENRQKYCRNEGVLYLLSSAVVLKHADWRGSNMEKKASAVSSSQAGCLLLQTARWRTVGLVRGEETPVLPSSSSCFYSVPRRQTGPCPDTLFSLRLFGGEPSFFSHCLCTGELQATRCSTDSTFSFSFFKLKTKGPLKLNIKSKFRHWWSLVKYFGFVFGLQTEAISSLRKNFMFPVFTWSTGERERARVLWATAGTMDRVLRPEIYRAAVASLKPKV